MNIQIQQVHTPQGVRWQVSLDQHGVSFASEVQARQFVSTLQARLQAPHPLPGAEPRLAGSSAAHASS